MNITESIKFNKLEAENQELKKELAEKDKEIKIYRVKMQNELKKLIFKNDKLKMYQHNWLKKSDVEVKVWCHSCERWVTDDIQDCYCRCTCNFDEDSDYDCIYEEDINAENDCPRNKEWGWQYEISEKQYESLEE